MLLMCKQTTNGSLSDGTLLCHQPFANSMAGFRERRLLWLLVASGGAWSLLEWMVVLPFTLPLGHPLTDDFGS